MYAKIATTKISTLTNFNSITLCVNICMLDRMLLLLNSFLPHFIRGLNPGGDMIQDNWHAHACEFLKTNVDYHIWKDGHIRRNIFVITLFSFRLRQTNSLHSWQNR